MTSFDLYPLETLANKKRLLPRELAEAKALLVFAHDPVLPWARLVNVDGKIGTKPVE